jgi:hypothetical protein
MTTNEPLPGLSLLGKYVLNDYSFHGDWSKENILKCYSEHNEEVQKVVPADRLLVLDLTKTENPWELICPFLGMPIPDFPFPHSNERQTFKDVIARLGNLRSSNFPFFDLSLRGIILRKIGSFFL